MRNSGGSEHLVWTTVLSRIQVLQGITQPSASHLCGQAAVTKKAYTPVLCYICLNSLLVPPCWRHFPESSLRLTLCLSEGGPVACPPPATLGTTASVGAPAHQQQLFPVGGFGTGSRLGGRDSVPAWRASSTLCIM